MAVRAEAAASEGRAPPEIPVALEKELRAADTLALEQGHRDLRDREASGRVTEHIACTNAFKLLYQ